MAWDDGVALDELDAEGRDRGEGIGVVDGVQGLAPPAGAHVIGSGRLRCAVARGEHQEFAPLSGFRVSGRRLRRGVPRNWNEGVAALAAGAADGARRRARPASGDSLRGADGP